MMFIKTNTFTRALLLSLVGCGVVLVASTSSAMQKGDKPPPLVRQNGCTNLYSNQKQKVSLLHLAVKSGCTHWLTQLLNKEENPNVLANGLTPLHCAAQSKNDEKRRAMLKILLDKGADPNIPTSQDQSTALHMVASVLDQTSFRLLLKHGAHSTLDAASLLPEQHAVGEEHIFREIVREFQED